MCWDFQEHEDELMELIESKLVEKEETLHPAPASDFDGRAWPTRQPVNRSRMVPFFWYN